MKCLTTYTILVKSGQIRSQKEDMFGEIRALGNPRAMANDVIWVAIKFKQNIYQYNSIEYELKAHKWDITSRRIDGDFARNFTPFVGSIAAETIATIIKSSCIIGRDEKWEIAY